MPRTALAGYVLYLLTAFGLRIAIALRRTGRTGIVRPSALASPTERGAGALLLLAMLVATAAPALQLAGLVEPIRFLDRAPAHAVGLVLGAAGIGLTLWAQLGMGDSWRIGVDGRERTRLVTHGLFAQVRNPIFTSTMLAAGGLALLAPNPVAVLAMAALVVAVEIHVRRVEEPYLLRTHGDAYRAYAGSVGRFVPGVGTLARASGDFIPALGLHALTPFFDLAAWIAGERRIKRHLLTRAAIAPDADVLDIGCGTGTLAIMAAAHAPSARVVGLDVDPAMLAIARRKVTRAGAPVVLTEGSATDPPFAPASFDRVLTTLVLHHLSTPQKRRALSAARRLLRPGGELHVADYGKPHTPLMRLASLTFKLFDGDDATGANVRGELPGLVREAGFDEVEETERWSTPFGTLTFLRAATRAA